MSDYYEKQADMIKGYLAGKDDWRNNLPEGHNYSPAYEHGWLNGRDDRIHKPRERASVLRARAEMILGKA
jgi:hypothetical protein